jgi:hypothetical protein
VFVSAGPGLTAIRATAAGQCLDPLYLFAGLLVEDGVTEVDVTVQARVRVILLFGRWVWFGCGRVIHGGLLSRLSGLRGVSAPAGPFLCLHVLLQVRT